MAEDAVAVMHEAFVRRTHVVGLSLGGMIAQELALLHPGRVGALVLQSTTAGRPWPRYVAPTVGLRWAAVLRALVARDAERRDRTLLGVVTTGPFAERADLSDPRVRAVLEAFQERISVDGFFGQLIAAAPYGAWRRLAGIAAPTLIQHGTKDGFLRPSAARAMAARIPGARLSVYEGAGHALALQHPESIAELVAFLREHDSVLAASR
jgi:pimeloyl-ACP methyl ester carboxylesterase